MQETKINSLFNSFIYKDKSKSETNKRSTIMMTVEIIKFRLHHTMTIWATSIALNKERRTRMPKIKNLPYYFLNSNNSKIQHVYLTLYGLRFLTSGIGVFFIHHTTYIILQLSSRGYFVWNCVSMYCRYIAHFQNVDLLENLKRNNLSPTVNTHCK